MSVGAVKKNPPHHKSMGEELLGQHVNLQGELKGYEARVKSGCTFSPKPDADSPTSQDVPASKRVSNKTTKRRKGSVHSNLHKLHEATMLKRVDKRKEIDALEMRACTFSPRLVGGRNSATSDVPVHERLFEGRKNKKGDKVAKVDKECSFQPRLTARQRQNSGEVGMARIDTLYQQGKAKQALRAKSPRGDAEAAHLRQEADELKMCTFHPNLSASKRTARKRPQVFGRSRENTRT
ncbi:unnamed protein product [Choristocarpus tenellus]